MSKVFTFKDEVALAKNAAEIISSAASESINKNGRFTIALSGGRTPAILYRLLAKPPHNDLSWKNIFVFWSDERCVPADDEKNNSYLAKNTLLDHVPIPAENIFSFPVKMPVSDGVKQYEKILVSFFKSELPAFDMILLGMGEDGHTASLFPGTNLHEMQGRLVAAVKRPGEAIDRITFTPQLINAAKNILILVTGQAKATVLSAVFANKEKNKYPVQLIKSSHLRWLVDEAAASSLKK
ncbi:MAG: 6-phosphogluconolactonase [Ferruginibacter sp.]